MLSIVTYKDGEGSQNIRDPATIRGLVADKSRVVWVDIEKPTPNEIDLLDIAFNFHPLTIDDCLSPRHQPKIDHYGEYLFLIFHEVLPQSSEKEFKTAELDMYLGKNYLVTFHKPKLRSIETVKERADRNARSVMKSADFLMAVILDEMVNLYIPVLDQFDRRIASMEDNVIDNQDNLLPEIFSLRRNLARLKGISLQQTDMLMSLAREGYDEVLPMSVPYLSNVKDHLIRITDRADSNRDAIRGLIEAHLLTSSNKANEVMKLLTIFAAIMLPLTVITGIYGMNFKNMPELEWEWGYPLILGCLAGIAGGLMYFFRKKKWL
ncbi:MAG TPA: magnesium/cobalt transporter CorA [bacterium]|nr:magnesium/cobalt transporter CorA [bacterium]